MTGRNSPPRWSTGPPPRSTKETAPAGASVPEAAQLDKEIEQEREREEAATSAGRARTPSARRIRRISARQISGRAPDRGDPADRRGRRTAAPRATSFAAQSTPSPDSKDHRTRRRSRPGAGSRRRSFALHQHRHRPDRSAAATFQTLPHASPARRNNRSNPSRPCPFDRFRIVRTEVKGNKRHRRRHKTPGHRQSQPGAARRQDHHHRASAEAG